MDFFDRQESSRRTTRYLVWSFGAAFLAVGLLTGFVLLLMMGFANNGTADVAMSGWAAVLGENIYVLAVTVAAVVGLMIISSLFRAATLSQGGGHVARMLGGTQITSDDTDPVHRRLINVVEEMAIASGLPVPEIYVLEAERGINAFAAGLTPADAAVAVTRGSLEHLSRGELQGVIAHEFSHILNGDMRLNLRLMGFSFGILVLFLVGRWMLRASSHSMRFSRRGKGSPAIMIGLALTVIGGVGVFLSRLIKAAVSRQREVLADASAVQFTREPMALAGALKKIGGFTPYIESAEIEEVSHMLFGRAGRSFTGLFATHPPLPERIRALDPTFREGDYIEPGSRAPGETTEPESPVSRLSEYSPEIGIESAGTIEPEIGAALRQAIPVDIVDAAHSSQSAWLLVLALGLTRGGGTDGERRLIETQLGRDRADRCMELRHAIDSLDAALHLPLIELTIPALKQRPDDQVNFLFELLAKLAEADGEISISEYLLQRLLKTLFNPANGARSSAGKRAEASLRLLATLAVEGHANRDAAVAAFNAGLAVLGQADRTDLDAYLDQAGSDRNFTALDRSLDELQTSSARHQRQVLTALAVTMRHDGTTGIAEAEIFRTVAAVLGCPVPPSTVIG